MTVDQSISRKLFLYYVKRRFLVTCEFKIVHLSFYKTNLIKKPIEINLYEQQKKTRLGQHKSDLGINIFNLGENPYFLFKDKNDLKKKGSTGYQIYPSHKHV